MDRKRIPADWRRRLAAVRAKIASEFASLPKDIDPYFQTLETEGFCFVLFFFFFFFFTRKLILIQFDIEFCFV